MCVSQPRPASLISGELHEFSRPGGQVFGFGTDGHDDPLSNGHSGGRLGGGQVKGPGEDQVGRRTAIACEKSENQHGGQLTGRRLGEEQRDLTCHTHARR